jgi:hypothetical protein
MEAEGRALNEQAEINVMSEEELNQTVEELCISKAEEFQLLGYEHVTGRDVWDCVSDKYVKTGNPPLHRIVNDILSLRVTQFMNWMTMNVYRGTHLD